MYSAGCAIQTETGLLVPVQAFICGVRWIKAFSDLLVSELVIQIRIILVFPRIIVRDLSTSLVQRHNALFGNSSLLHAHNQQHR